MDFRSLLLLPVVFYAVVATAAPNLIVIMADDLGYSDVGFNGCKDIPTPNIDSIASHGVRCTNGYVSYSVCGPSRAGFITGRYQQRFGFERNPQYKPNDPDMGLTQKEKTIAELLAPVGYQSGIIGKWHLGAHAPTGHPMKRGFDEFYGHLGGGHRYMPEDLVIKDSAKARGEAESYRTWILKNHTPVPPRKYLTDEFSDEAVSFVERNKAKPFFLFLSYNAPHTPLQATAKYLNRFTHIKDPKRKTYAAMVSAIDDGVGLLLKSLRKNKLEEKTIVAFLSDNGGPITKNASSNTPLRGAKGDVWEGGQRVPFALQWKGTLPAGKTYDHPVSSLDFAATMVALSGAKVDKDKPLDGVNLIPYLKGDNAELPHESLYLRKFDQQRYSVRRGKYKLVIPFFNGKPRLYDLDEDIGETIDLATVKPKILSELDALRQKWSAQLIEPTFMGLIHLPSRNKKKNKK
jgi:arylsulfatase A-like enzyme